MGRESYVRNILMLHDIEPGDLVYFTHNVGTIYVFLRHEFITEGKDTFWVWLLDPDYGVVATFFSVSEIELGYMRKVKKPRDE